ncbi:hypothetical protein [Crateriforma conspicua]|uniref:Uncharacterized protein n=1 Tax=Crateriforma conspicua TaxID=2527996 RepID=A0A5C5Y9W9_9PLAN|nr:hypothetical protein [Crateriforma conspicua]QDV61825.1 hypothetical protein Mal65_09520 [Crateriforma conspicua]TWT71924.1 hypothetical protein Pan14r_42410 [Crateriforma conspicua]
MKTQFSAKAAVLTQRFGRIGLTRRTVRVLLPLTLIVLGASTASADWHSFWHSFHIKYARNRAWPEPFTEVDAAQTMAPFEVMKHNGWRAHNTIGHDLFRRGDGALLAAGRERIKWIATQAPEQRRAVYVLQGENDQETQARVTSVHDMLQRLHFNGAPPRVMVTHIEPPSAPGPWAEKIHREWLNRLPAPVLPSTTAAGTSGITTASGASGGSSGP